MLSSPMLREVWEGTGETMSKVRVVRYWVGGAGGGTRGRGLGFIGGFDKNEVNEGAGGENSDVSGEGRVVKSTGGGEVGSVAKLTGGATSDDSDSSESSDFSSSVDGSSSAQDLLFLLVVGRSGFAAPGFMLGITLGGGTAMDLATGQWSLGLNARLVGLYVATVSAPSSERGSSEECRSTSFGFCAVWRWLTVMTAFSLGISSGEGEGSVGEGEECLGLVHLCLWRWDWA